MTKKKPDSEFNKAFDRYERKVDTSKIKNFRQLQLNWASNMTQNMRLSYNQRKALAKEGRDRLGLKTIIREFKMQKFKTKTGYTEKLVTRYRDLGTREVTTKTGKVVRKGGLFVSEKEYNEAN